MNFDSAKGTIAETPAPVLATNGETPVTVSDATAAGTDDTDEALLPSERARQMEAQERREAEEMKRQRDPPIVFRDVGDPATELERLRNLLSGKLNDAEIQNVDELHQYLLENEGSWALGDNFLNFVGQFIFFIS